VAKHAFGRDDLSGVRVAVQGVGQTGGDLCRQLAQAGASLIVADVNQALLNEVATKYKAVVVVPEVIHAQEVDIFAPCAMGGIINDITIPEIKAKAICGLANNQLEKPQHGIDLQERGICYVPDYVVNAGGMMGASTVIFDTPSRKTSEQRILGLYDTILSILGTANDTKRPSSEVADEMAETIILDAKTKQRKS